MGGSDKSYKSSKSSEDRRDWAKERGPFRRPESPRRRSRSPFRGNTSKHHSYRPDKYRHQRYDNDLRRQLQEPRTSRDHRSPSPASQPAWKYKGSINASHYDDQPSADQLASHQSNRRRGQSVESVVHLEPIRSGPQPASHNRDGSDGRRHSKEPNGRDETPGNRTSGAPRQPTAEPTAEPPAEPPAAPERKREERNEYRPPGEREGTSYEPTDPPPVGRPQEKVQPGVSMEQSSRNQGAGTDEYTATVGELAIIISAAIGGLVTALRSTPTNLSLDQVLREFHDKLKRVRETRSPTRSVSTPRSRSRSSSGSPNTSRRSSVSRKSTKSTKN